MIAEIIRPVATLKLPPRRSTGMPTRLSAGAELLLRFSVAFVNVSFGQAVRFVALLVLSRGAVAGP